MLGHLARVAAAGALGTLARYGLSVLLQRRSAFPYGTLAVNVLGCFLFGVVWTLASERAAIDEATRTVVLVGFLGGFTTFSSYAFETAEMLRAGVAAAAGYALLQNALGIAAVLAGRGAVRLLG